MNLVTRIVSYGIKQGSKTTKEVLNTWRYPIDIYHGAKSANRLRKIQNCGILKTVSAHGTNILRQTGRHIPGMLAGVATPIPLPGTSAIGFGIGKILQKLINLI